MYDRAAVSNRRIDPSNGFGPLGAVVTLHSSVCTNKSVVQPICQGKYCQTNSHFKSCVQLVDLKQRFTKHVYM
jgi:hypothetical protein